MQEGGGVGMRLIDADALKEDYLWCKSESTPWDDTWDAAMSRVDMQPTIHSESAKWISVKDKMPKHEYGEGDSVLTIDLYGEMRVAYFDGGNWLWPTGEPIGSFQIAPIAYWMPLPEPPKEEEE